MKTAYVWYQYNAKLHTTLRTVEYVANFGCSVIANPPHGLDLLLSGLDLFGLMKVNSVDSIFQAEMQLQNSGSPPLVQIVMSITCRLLFNSSENAQLMSVIVLKIVFSS